MTWNNIPLETKERAIQLFKQGHGSWATARQLAINETTVRQWYSLYSRYGEEELRMPRRSNKHYPYELKVAAARDFCEQGLTIEEVLAKYDIRSRTQVKTWARIYQTKGPLGLTQKVRGRARKDPDAAETLEERCLRLEVENAYLKKLSALMDEQQQQRRR